MQRKIFKSVLIGALLCPLALYAQIYQCVDASGKVAFQGQACPSASVSNEMTQAEQIPAPAPLQPSGRAAANLASPLGQSRHGQLLAARQPQNIHSQALPSCPHEGSITTAQTPFDLWKSIPACVATNQFEQAIFMYGLAGAEGRFDASRVQDPSAAEAAQILPMLGMSAMSPPKAEAFKQKVLQSLGDANHRAALCRAIKAMPAPSYFPTYMVNHGMQVMLNQMQHQNTPALVKGFNSSLEWPKAVDAYLHCP